MRVLVVNAGSSSLDLRLIGPDDELVARRRLEAWMPGDATDVVEQLRALGPADAIGHRVVHGGATFRAPTLIDDDVEAQIASLAPLAPLHQPRALAGVRAAREALPDVPAVACFDTAFHASLPSAAATYALPAAWRDRWDLRRYGFHGLSHASAIRSALDYVGHDRESVRVITCHLGAGASLCASIGGRSRDTTMGFTPLEGLVMATRSGSVDPGLLLWLITQGGLSAEEVGRALEEDAGLAGLSRGSGDMRDVLAARAAGDDRAHLAFDVYIHRLAREIAAMAASITGLDVLVFTGGVGEHAPLVREAAGAHLEFLGVAIDPARNAAAVRPIDSIAAEGARVTTLVVEAREDLEIARATRAVVAGSPLM